MIQTLMKQDLFRFFRSDVCRALIFGVILASFAIQGYAQDVDSSGRRKFYSIAELIRIIERAREAGMSEAELRKLELRDGDKQINVLDYIEQEKLRRLQKDKKIGQILNKKFLTINDIYNELIKSEPEVIERLREELVSER